MHRALLPLLLLSLALPAAAATVRRDPPANAVVSPPGALALGPAVLLAWVEATPDGLRLQVARLDGAAWSPAVTVASGLSPRGAEEAPALARSGDGALWLAWSRIGAGVPDLALARSGDGGRTWQPEPPLPAPGKGVHRRHPVLQGTAKGVRVFWIEAAGKEISLWGAELGPVAAPPARLEAGGPVVSEPPIVAAAGGEPVLMLRHANEEVRVLRRQKGRWGAPLPLVGTGGNVRYLQGAGEGDRAVVGWAPSGSRQLHVTWFKEGRPAGAARSLVRGPVLVLAADTEGDALLAWLVEGRLLLERVRPDGQAGPTVELATGDLAHPALVRHGPSLSVIWVERPAGALRLAQLPAPELPGPAAAAEGPPPTSPTALGAAMPPLSGKALNGRQISLKGLKGKVVLVNVLASWCKPCVDELPILADAQRRLGDRGLQVVGIGMDENLSDLKALVAKLPFPVLHDPAGARAGKLFAVETIPLSFIYGRDGRLIWYSRGGLSADDPAFNAALEAALGP